MALNWIAILRKIDSLGQLEEKHGEAIRRLSAELEGLKDRVARLELRDEVLIARAEGAASTATVMAASSSLSDLARRIGTLEERSRTRALPPPDKQDMP
ncbi:hypothetical protein [Roseicella aquatilis]|uniref:Uncharacterized protein n=1 Tax=Roseicella aquatilis TaxID=2527868 RepID=A0A4R4D7J1_9PROT|nr:hypothetical protein [Roseicella aquatilis]TCZ56314.1 hypothetical protein EXY23_20245 [Roseicella aquatilis]